MLNSSICSLMTAASWHSQNKTQLLRISFDKYDSLATYSTPVWSKICEIHELLTDFGSEKQNAII